MASEQFVPLSEYHRLPQAALSANFYKRQLEVVCNNATLALFIMDEYQRCVYMNPAAEALTGYSLAETQGRALHDVIHHTRPDGSLYPLCECPIDQVFPQNNREQGEEVFVHKDGHFYPVAYTASPIREEDTTIGTIIEVRDITQEKLDEQARQDVKTILSSINDGFYTLDRNWRFTYVNDRYCEMVQMPSSELLGQSIWELFPAAVDTEVYVQFHQAMAEQTPRQFDYLYTPWNCWHDYRIYPSLTGLTVLIADITERKQADTEREQLLQREQALRQQAETAEAKLQQVLTSIREDFVLFDRDWHIAYLNAQAANSMGLSREEALGKNIWDLFPDLIDTEFYDRLHQVMRDRTPIQFEYYYPTWDRWFENRLYSTLDGIVNLCSDITDRKWAELNERFLNMLDARLRQLADANEMLWEAMSRVGEYLNVDRCIWHDIDLANGLVIIEQDWRRQEIPSAVGVHPLSDFSLPDLLAQCQTGQTVVVSDVMTHPDTASFAKNYTSFGTRAFITVPCLYEGFWVASLVVNTRIPRNWRADEIALLQEIVARLWSLIEHTQAVQEFRQSEAKFRQLANAMPQIVWVADADGSLEFVNDRWTEYTGLTLEQSRDRALMEQLIPPEDNQQLYADFAQALAARSPYQSQFRIIRPDGSYLYFLTRAIPLLDEQRQVRKWYGTSTDITELKQLEVELRQKNAILDVVNESAPTPIFVKDRQGRIIYANPATLEVLGKTAEEVMGYRDCDLYPNPEDAARVMENDRRIMESGQIEVVEESPDGVRTFLGMKVPYRNEVGEVIGLIGISNDISDRVQLERDRERILQQEQTAREAAENANRIKDEFLAVLSHELRTPLNPILGWAKLLQQGKLDAAKTQTALTTIERNAQLQVQLIDDLLDISRILRGKLSLEQAPVDLSLAIVSALETVRLAAEAKAIDLRFTILACGLEEDPKSKTQTPKLQVLGDAGRLQQVVWNLLANAVKFTPSTGQVTVTLTQIGTSAQIQVTDTGKGIKPEFLPYVFEHFRQEDGATTRKFGGLGLGLAIARQIVELHGGTIAVGSLGEGQGTTFTVQLPLAPLSSQLPSSEPSSALANDLKGIHIFVVDDEPDSRDFVAFVLEQAGAIVSIFASGIEALQAIEQSIPDLIVSDIGMPAMDGYRLLQQIRARAPASQLPALALTGYAGELDRQQALQAEFQFHLAKPVEPAEIVTTVARLCGRKGGDA